MVYVLTIPNISPHSEIETVFGAGDETCNDMIPPFVNNDTCRYTCITYFITGCQ